MHEVLGSILKATIKENKRAINLDREAKVLPAL
jgi:hypothetical protein